MDQATVGKNGHQQGPGFVGDQNRRAGLFVSRTSRQWNPGRIGGDDGQVSLGPSGESVGLTVVAAMVRDLDQVA